MRAVLRAFLPVLAILIAVPAQSQAPPIVGTWQGELEVPGARLPLVFHITGSAGALTATMDSPMQGARGIPIDSVHFVEGELTLRVLGIGGTYQGRLVADSLVGEWRQGGMALPLTLRRAEAGAGELPRPQHPQPPFPYRSAEVQFENPAAGIRLAGTLTLPPAGGPFPAAVLVTGSGPQDRDETILGHKPFLVLADHLTRAGIAVLRYDDRGVGESGGDFASGTTIDFAGDAAAAIAWLRRHPEVDPSRVGLIGHSEGGLIAPLVATGAFGAPQAPLGYVVLLAGPALPGEEILRLQSAAISSAMGATPEQVEQSLQLQARMFEILRSEADDDARRTRLRALLRDGLAGMSPEDRAQAGVAPGQEEPWIQAQVAAVGTRWFREFIELDPRPALRQLRTPTLALFGALDLQVPPDENAAAMREALAAAGNPDFTVLTLPRLNHLFQTATTGAPAEYAAIEETFAPAALNAVSAWILERFGGRAAK